MKINLFADMSLTQSSNDGPSWLKDSGVILETYAFVPDIGQVGVSKENHPHHFASECEWLASVFQVDVSIVKDWRAWTNDDHQCRAYNSNGQRCKCDTNAYYISPADYVPDEPPYCKHHKDPKKRKQPKAQRKSLAGGYIYLLHATGTDRYKIGLTKNMSQRIKALAKQSPFPVEIIHYYKTNDMRREECALHESFQEYRVHGEWFQLPDFAVSEICGLEDCA